MGAIKQKMHEVADTCQISMDEVMCLGNDLFFEIVKLIDDGNIKEAKREAQAAKEDQGYTGYREE